MCFSLLFGKSIAISEHLQVYSERTFYCDFNASYLKKIEDKIFKDKSFLFHHRGSYLQGAATYVMPQSAQEEREIISAGFGSPLITMLKNHSQKTKFD